MGEGQAGFSVTNRSSGPWVTWTTRNASSYIGGKARFMHKSDRRRKNLKGGGSAGKAIVLGILERETEDKPKRVRATVIPDRTKPVMQENVRPHVEAGSQVYSDEAGDYWRWTPSTRMRSSTTQKNTCAATFILTAWRTFGAF